MSQWVAVEFQSNSETNFSSASRRQSKQVSVNNMAASLSPTANLLRKSRLFSLPKAITSLETAAARNRNESDTATLPYPVRASIVTPASSLSRGDWGLKRPLPAKSTSQKSSRPVVRINALDTFEHVTDFDSAADHTMTLEKFQELNLPISLPTRSGYSTSIVPRHHSPFEANVDNTEATPATTPDTKQFRHTGPWLGGLTEAEFGAYLDKITEEKPRLMRKLRRWFYAKRKAELRNQAQDKGEDLENLPPVTKEEFDNYVKTLRSDPYSLGPVIFELLDLPSAPAVPNDRIGSKYFASPPTKMPAAEYATYGPPMTHPSAGLSYARSHASIYNHPKYGPQAHQRPVEARVLRPRGRVRGKAGRAVAGVGGIAFEDLSAMTFAEQGAPPGLASFDATIPGGAKYYVQPIRASIKANGQIALSSYRASASAKLAHDLEDYKKQSAAPRFNPRAPASSRNQRAVPRLDQARTSPVRRVETEQPETSREDVARNLMKTLTSR